MGLAHAWHLPLWHKIKHKHYDSEFVKQSRIIWCILTISHPHKREDCVTQQFYENGERLRETQVGRCSQQEVTQKAAINLSQCDKRASPSCQTHKNQHVSTLRQSALVLKTSWKFGICKLVVYHKGSQATPNRMPKSSGMLWRTNWWTFTGFSEEHFASVFRV
jgi:hypothetical protein